MNKSREEEVRRRAAYLCEHRSAIERDLAEAGVRAWRCHRDWLSQVGRPSDERLHEDFVTERIRQALLGPVSCSLPEALSAKLEAARIRDLEEFPAAFEWRTVQMELDPWYRMMDIMSYLDHNKAIALRTNFVRCCLLSRKTEIVGTNNLSYEISINEKNYREVSRGIFAEIFSDIGFVYDARNSRKYIPVYSKKISDEISFSIQPNDETYEYKFARYKTRFEDNYSSPIGFSFFVRIKIDNNPSTLQKFELNIFTLIDGFRDAYNGFIDCYDLAVNCRAYALFANIFVDHFQLQAS